MLLGEAGTSKTASVRQFASLNKIPLVQVNCAFGFRLSAWIGRLALKPGHSGPVTAFEYGRLVPFMLQRSIILIDELTLIDPEHQAPFFKLLENRALDSESGEVEIKLSPATWIVMTGNPAFTGRYSGTSGINPAIQSRVAGCVLVQEFEPAELSRIIGSRIPEDRREQLILFYSRARDMANRAQNNFKSIITLRHLEHFISLFPDLSGEISRLVDITLLNPARMSGRPVEFDNYRQLAASIFAGYQIN